MSIEKLRPPVRPPRSHTSIDVAQRAGVSQPTVSRFLNGKVVSAAASEAIARAIEELGYSPNSNARSLVTRRSGLIAVILGDLLNGYYDELYTVIQRTLGQHGLQPIIFEGEAKNDNLPGELLAGLNVDGVIVATSLLRSSQERIIAARQLPTIFVNRSRIRKQVTVGADNRLGGRIAAQHLVALGHTRLAMITGPARAEAVVARSKGFLSELAEHKIYLDQSNIDEADFDYDRAYAAAMKLLSRAERPTAIFGHNDQIAIATINAASTMGIRVPEDLSIIGFDDVRYASWERISLTTVQQPIREIGTTAVELLLKLIKAPEQRIKSVLLPCVLVERRSTASAPTRKK